MNNRKTSGQGHEPLLAPPGPHCSECNRYWLKAKLSEHDRDVQVALSQERVAKTQAITAAVQGFLQTLPALSLRLLLAICLWWP